jgi:hypothetical protein
MIAQLLMSQLKTMGFDPDVAQANIKQAVDDIHAMKESQDRCEAMLNSIVKVRERSFGEVAKAYADDAVKA